MFPSSSLARRARVKAERQARAPFARTVNIWLRVPPSFAAQVEYERKLYAIRPTKAEVVRQLLEEGLCFRRLNRPKRAKRPGLPQLPPARPKRFKRVRVPFIGLD